ncbi:hypothetical protein BB934_29820 (plasmid) [Microvirga ossetica]|uniref:Uncharacterized protein n=1 Tax=Microvirga ossetica TaxID=1882682 RepID=A0A1B2ER93_9HYPH|nr:hypothetical protein [Microvirga ossetica]ANY82487.1 hypothetical protein BB934_29820 [Microvirga ossetica]
MPEPIFRRRSSRAQQWPSEAIGPQNQPDFEERRRRRWERLPRNGERLLLRRNMATAPNLTGSLPDGSFLTIPHG